MENTAFPLQKPVGNVHLGNNRLLLRELYGKQTLSVKVQSF
jgi:hypothetical protein